MLFCLLFPVGTTSQNSAAGPEHAIEIGSYYADVQNGLTFIDHDRGAFLLRIGWVEKDSKDAKWGEDLAYSFTGSTAGTSAGSTVARYLNNRIWLKPVKTGPASPDGSISVVSWMVDGVWITLEWGRTGNGTAVGRIASEGPVRVALHATPSWDSFVTTYTLLEQGIEGSSRRSGKGNQPPITWRLRVNQRPAAKICLSYTADVAPLVIGGRSADAGEGTHAALVYDLEKDRPLEFAAGFGALPELDSVPDTLSSAVEAYEARRVKASGDWGPFLQAMMNQLNHNKVYNFKTGRICHVITRNWCRTDGQILFKWDSFFNALMSSLEDPAGARDTIRCVLAEQQKNGLIPSYSGPRWEVSWDRSQPVVEAMCVWKIHQRWPDAEFLAEVYPRLKRAHEWWFSVRPATGLPYRDGNRNGLLEWGTNKPVPELSLARYESGMDDSPMFDRVTMNQGSGTMELDMAGLSSLWAMNAEYLARIADELGEEEDAASLRRQSRNMARRIEKLLWNEDLGIYCNRFWAHGSRKDWGEVIAPRCFETPSGEEGLEAEYFRGTQFDNLVLKKTDPNIDFTTGPSNEAVGRYEYSVRWNGFLIPEKTGPFRFTVISDDGFRLWVDDKLLITDWSIHEREVDVSSPVMLEAGKKVSLRMEYFQERWKSQITLGWIFGESAPQPQLLSPRLSPTCFYPLIVGSPDRTRVKRMKDLLQDPNKFWGEFILPSVPRDDPAFPELHYWRGKIWPSSNYLAYLGLKRTLSPEQRLEFSRKNVRMFMNNWVADGGCYENYTPDGKGSSDPHYSWGALLCLIGLEEIFDIEPDGRVRLNGVLEENIELQNIPHGGRIYSVEVGNRRATVRHEGEVILEALEKPEFKRDLN